jgi:Dullard-like phosphatase family protein
VFTAGTQEYAEPILDQLDPNGDLFSLRLYRQHCIKRDNFFIKDLRVITNLDLNKTVLIDNSIISFAFQINNGIPIHEFTGMHEEANDQELLYMVQFLEDAFLGEDVRDFIKESFNL